MICQLYPSFVSNFKSKTQKMAQEPYFENSDQSCKSNNTLKNCTNIFGNNLLPNWLCLLLIPSYFPSLLESQSLSTMPQKRKTKNWEATLDIKKEMQKKKNRKRVRWFLPISRKISMPLVSQISYLAMYMLAKKGSKREDSLKKNAVFFFAASWQSPKN